MEGAYSARHAIVYDFFVPDREKEVVFWEKIAKSYGKKILDVMAGTGEVACKLVKKGFIVTGIDISRDMLKMAKKRQLEIKKEPKLLKLLEFDVLNLNLEDKDFDFACIIGSSLGSFLNEAHQKQCLKKVWNHLRKGAGIGIEILNPASFKEETPWLTFKPVRPLPPGLRAFKTTKEIFNKNTGIQHVNNRFEIMMGQEKLILNYEEDIKFFKENELRELLLDCGFEDITVYGDYNYGGFVSTSPKIIMIAQKI